MALSTLFCLLTLAFSAQSYVAHVRNATIPSTSPVPLLELDEGAKNDPSDFSWVRRWAAIGDSYTAGIGSGSPLGNILQEKLEIKLSNGLINGHGDWYCARYDMSYPMIIDRLLGEQVEDFQYLACSGDRTSEIYQQAQQLKGDLDLVMMTAGGNDLCLSGIIKDCIMLASNSFDACEAIISKAEENAEKIVKNNVKDILLELNNKMNDHGIVVVNGYAEFFNTDDKECEDQAWDVFWWLALIRHPEKLTIERRKRFNQLVRKTNNALAEAVNEVAKEGNTRYKVGFADWNPWVYEAVDGQMCSTASNGDYPDPKQPDMQFIKPDTHPWPNWADDIQKELRSRQLSEENKVLLDEMQAEYEVQWKREEEHIYGSILFNSPNPPGIVHMILNSRDPTAPGCPGDGKLDMTLGLGLPNTFGANFHPNENGHATIASFAIAEAMDLRSLVLGIGSPSCEVEDQFKCWSSEGRRAYSNADRLDNNYKDFCANAQKSGDTTSRIYRKIYDEGTPEEHEFVVELSGNVGTFHKDECLDSMKSLIHSCDTQSKMNWKYGGKYVRSNYTYEINPQRKNRPWPPPENPVGRCEGWYKVLWSSYEIEGGGFSTWDYGQKTMLPSMNDCYGFGTTAWMFEYYDEPTGESYEWKATFNAPPWVRSRCFKNNRVAKAAGGWTNGCNGND